MVSFFTLYRSERILKERKNKHGEVLIALRSDLVSQHLGIEAAPV